MNQFNVEPRPKIEIPRSGLELVLEVLSIVGILIFSTLGFYFYRGYRLR